MTAPSFIYKRDDGCWAWEAGNEHVYAAMASICEDLRGHSDEELAEAINVYLAKVYAEHRSRLN
jgi:adenosylmethionine-8-amino-7-oxononanoate aminotransferase